MRKRSYTENTDEKLLWWCGMCEFDISRRQNRGKGQQPKDNENRRLCGMRVLVVEDEKWAMPAA